MFNQNTFQLRTQKLQKQISTGQLLLISSSSDIAYLSNFEFLVPEEREAFLAVSKNSVNLIYSSFSPIDDYSYINYMPGTFPNQLAENLVKIAKTERVDKLLIDKETLFVKELEEIKKLLPDLKIEELDPKILAGLRFTKEEKEVESIKQACQITAEVLKSVQSELRAGLPEIEVKKMIDKEFNSRGVEELAFPTIVAFGENSALPHHQPSEKKLEKEMVVLIDLGGKVNGYCADMTRTFWFGEKPSNKFLEIEGIVREAYQAVAGVVNANLEGSGGKSGGAESGGAGSGGAESGGGGSGGAESGAESGKNLTTTAKNLDNAARTLITNKGYGENFIHTTGHGLGLSIHEQPSLSWKNSTEIKPGMVITIEPGIYLEDEFGYRHENTVLVAPPGLKELTKL